MPKINPRIKSIDDLLGLDAAEESPIEPTPSVSLPTKNTIITLPPQAIRAFRGHPFRLYEGDRLNDLVESISEHGVLNPAIIRKIERDEDGFEYEMLAGHNRQNAAAIANRELPCIVKENLSDEDAWIYVIETNVLQRSFSEMLPSEKAAVLALRYSKMICQGRRNDIKAMTAFNTRELDAFIEELVRCYGTERAMYVLSRTIQFSDWDARFDQAVLDRAGKTDFPDTREPREAHQVDPTTRYVTEIDPCVVNAVFVKLMELEDEQEETNHMNEIEQDELDEDMTAEL